MTNVKSENATLTWLHGPGEIDHYRVEVNSGMNLMDNLTDSTPDPVILTDLTTDLKHLVAGTRYTVKVFPVKCERDLNPQNTTFYTSELLLVHLTDSSAPVCVLSNSY